MIYIVSLQASFPVFSPKKNKKKKEKKKKNNPCVPLHIVKYVLILRL